MRKVKTRKKSKIIIILLFVLIIPILVSKLQIGNNNFNSTDMLSSVENQITGSQNSNNDTSISNNDVLILVNNNNKLPEDYNVDLTTYQNYKMATILIDDLKDMYNSALKEGISLEISSAYRNKAEQQKIFDNTVSEYMKNGDSNNVAVQKTKKTVALTGYSEHETGLAIDFSDSDNYNQRLEMWNWLSENAYKYGFILRYPKGKENITGYDYEAWHYRYVGKKDAIIIYESGVTLEEYLNAEQYVEEYPSMRKLQR